MKFFGLLSVLASFVAGVLFLAGMKGAQSAPQEAAIAGMALAIAVIPYVFFRVAQALKQGEDLEAIRKLLETLVDARNTPAPLPAAAPLYQAPVSSGTAHVLKSHRMGQDGWWWREMSDGGIRISDPHGTNYDYPSVDAAKSAFTWWTGPESA